MVDLANILVKFNQFDIVLKFCKLFTNVNSINSGNDINSEILKYYFVCYLKKGDYDSAYYYYKESKEHKLNLDQYKEEEIILLFKKREMEQVNNMM